MPSTSQALSSAARLKPELRLAQAVSEYVSDLTDVQKSVFRNHQGKACELPPAIGDVMKLTAEIDSQLAKRTRRCLGPRLTNFLKSVQEFAALGDVIVGGSQNLIACGIWSASITKYSSFLEEISNVLMHVGHSAPRYQTMALMYPQSKKLPALLSEYFIVVVRLCRRLLKFSQRSAFGQLTSSLTDSELKTYKADFDVWANSIKEEATLLMSKGILDESQESSRFRKHSRRYQETKALQQKVKMRKRALDLCSVYDHETIWRQTRKVGQASLHQHSPEYKSWRDGDTSCTLICAGKLGSGKSVLLANIIDDLNLSIGQSGDNAKTAAYFFCRNDTPESLKAQTIVGSLARQLLHQIPDVMLDMVTDADDISGSERALEVVKRTIPSGAKAYFVLDGLDECDRSEGLELIEMLKQLQQHLTLHICVSFRLEPDVSLRGSFSDPILMILPEKNPDIESFIGRDLEACLESGRLSIGDPALILEIQNALMSGSQGMFLWVVLQIETLCLMKTDQEIREALKDLPRTLSETFSRILERHKQQGSYQRKILELLTVARRPLTMNELQDALSVVPGDTTWDPSKLVNDIYSVLQCCGCLIAVDEEELTVRLVHFSVKQFLLKSFLQSSSAVTASDRVERTMTEICVTYLAYGIFETQISTAVVPNIPVGSVPQTIIDSTLELNGKSTKDLAIRLLKSRNTQGPDIGSFLAQRSGRFLHLKKADYHFFRYANEYWLEHILRTFNPVGENINGLIVQVCDRLIANQSDLCLEIRPLLIWSAMQGYDNIIHFIFSSSGACPPEVKLYEVSLLWAVKKSNLTCVEELCKMHKAYLPETLLQVLQKAVFLAAVLNHEDIFRTLTHVRGYGSLYDDQFVMSNGSKEFLNTASPKLLHLGYERVYTELWEAWGKKVYLGWENSVYGPAFSLLFDPRPRYSVRFSPLYIAVKTGNAYKVERIVGSGQVPLNDQDANGATPLLIAIKRRDLGVFRMLRDTGKVRMDLCDTAGNNALFYAAATGQVEMVRSLLDEKAWERLPADYHEEDLLRFDEATPLCIAAKNGHEDAVRYLLDSDTVSLDAGYPLWYAVKEGHLEICRILLQHQAHLWLKPPNVNKGYPVFLAIAMGYFEIVSLMIRHIYETDSSGAQHALSLEVAARKEDEESLRVLLLTDHNGDFSLVNKPRKPEAMSDADFKRITDRMLGKIPLVSARLRGYLLQVAAKNRDIESAEQVLKLNPCITREELDYRGLGDQLTPLMHAERHQDHQMVELLSRHGANPEVMTDNGRTAATERRSAEMLGHKKTRPPSWFSLDDFNSDTVNAVHRISDTPLEQQDTSTGKLLLRRDQNPTNVGLRRTHARRVKSH